MEENDEENEKNTNFQKIKKPKLNENFINFINNKINKRKNKIELLNLFKNNSSSNIKKPSKLSPLCTSYNTNSKNLYNININPVNFKELSTNLNKEKNIFTSKFNSTLNFNLTSNQISKSNSQKNFLKDKSEYNIIKNFQFKNKNDLNLKDNNYVNNNIFFLNNKFNKTPQSYFNNLRSLKKENTYLNLYKFQKKLDEKYKLNLKKEKMNKLKDENKYLDVNEESKNFIKKIEDKEEKILKKIRKNEKNIKYIFKELKIKITNKELPEIKLKRIFKKVNKHFYLNKENENS